MKASTPAAGRLLPLDDLEQAVQRSFSLPVLIFKHSSTCGTSAYAYEEVRALVADPPVETEVFVVHIQAQRALSAAVAARFQLRHESPQVLIVRDGALLWSASHFRVTADEIGAALSARSR